MKLTCIVHYRTLWGETLYISGDSPTLGSWDEAKARPLTYTPDDQWLIELELPEPSPSDLTYKYLVRDAEGRISRREDLLHHHLTLRKDIVHTYAFDSWLDTPLDAPSFSVALLDIFKGHTPEAPTLLALETPQITFQVFTSSVPRGAQLFLSGSSDTLGAWSRERMRRMHHLGGGRWAVTLPYHIEQGEERSWEYKFVIQGTSGETLQWEEGENRVVTFTEEAQGQDITITDGLAHFPSEPLRLSGCVVPLFALRGEQDFGIGDFGTLRGMIDLVSEAGMNALQLLPINDTTFTRGERDSYPYNAISVDALHPIYINLAQLPPLHDVELRARLEGAGAELRGKDTIDYPQVIHLKEEYLRALFDQEMRGQLPNEAFATFLREEERWLEPYAYYCLIRDKREGLPPTAWGDDRHYDLRRLRTTYSSVADTKTLLYHKWVQYLLNTQLTEVRDYARSRGIFLKGDLPIGVAPHGVEVWIAPELFHLEQSAGAPPDDFAVDGQNWGFPTYNWEAMAGDRFLWWRRRLERLSHYFDALRIDHVLGFFRIWEEPRSEVSGLLGHFHPALPYTLEQWQDFLGETPLIPLLTHPLIHQEDLQSLLGKEALDDLISRGLVCPTAEDKLYTLRHTSQQAYEDKTIIEAVGGVATARLLSQLCTETALIRDPYSERYHPRIAWERSLLFQHWEPSLQEAWFKVSHNFYYIRHNALFRDTGYSRLSALVEQTGMLLCAEDLGMIPSTVPEVLHQLQILTLELERMPKDFTPHGWASPQLFPYHSIATTSTHDMPSLRGWWHSLPEDKRQAYLIEELGRSREEVPALLTQETLVYRLILQHYLTSPALGVLLPLSDWMSIEGDLAKQRPEEEQINHPEQADHYWAYRFPFSAETLLRDYPHWVQLIQQYMHHSNRSHRL